MAFRIRPFYNVDFPVGQLKPNRRDDVTLVQFFLNNVRKHPNLLLGALVVPKSTLIISGNFDNATHDWIVAFQAAIKGGFQPGFLVDGIVDPNPGYNLGKTSITHTAYTISLLNNAYHSSNADMFSHIWDDADMPNDVGNKLKEDAR